MPRSTARRLVLLLPLLLAGVLAGACGGGESDTAESMGGARLVIAYPADIALQAVAKIYGSALEKAGAKVSYDETTPGDLGFDVEYEGGAPVSVVPRIRSTAVTPAIRAEIDKVDKALSVEELKELQEQTDPKEEDPITPTAAALRWLGLNGF